MDDKKIKEINDVITFFNRQVSQIFKFIDSCDDYKDNALLDKVRLIVKVVKVVEPADMLERCIDKLWDNREAVIGRDAAFFKDSNVMYSYIKEDENKEWLTGLIDFIKEQYDTFDDDEIDKIWTYINNMLEAVIKYRMLTGM